MDRQNDSATIFVAADSRIDYESSAAFQRSLLDALGDACGALVIDFSAVEYISSVGLSALVVAAKKSQAAGGHIAVACLQPLVREIFEISRFDLLIPIFESVDEARAGIARGGA